MTRAGGAGTFSPVDTPMKLVTAAQMRALDRRTIEEAGVPSLTLMERAGTGVVFSMERRFGPLAGVRVVVLCGKGNNGGDGFVVARALAKKRAKVTAVLVADAGGLSRDAKVMHRRFVAAAGRASVVPTPSGESLRSLLRPAGVIVDALLGTGLASPVTGPFRTAIEAANDLPVPIVAVDVPSGLQADTGAVLGVAIRATLTVTFGQPKVGLYLGAGIDHAGTVHIVDIGIPPAYVDELDCRTTLLTCRHLSPLLPPRKPSAHKGTFGHAGIIAGSIGKTGAAALAAKAALRTGAGLVTVATPTGANDVLEAKLLEAMTAPMPQTKGGSLARSALDRLKAFTSTKTALAIGPGLTTHPETVDLLQTLIPQLDRPAILDADALNALAGKPSLLAECKVSPILTPHPGEMARLEEEATPQTINADRLGVAARFAQRRNVTLVLKGARTVLAHPDGRMAICPTGNPGMATAGTGDVLTGMMAGLLAQRMDAWDAACAAVYFHGAAGDLAATEKGSMGMVAGDLVEHIPAALLLRAGPEEAGWP